MVFQSLWFFLPLRMRSSSLFYVSPSWIIYLIGFITYGSLAFAVLFL